MKKYAVRNLRLCTKDCLCLYVCPTGATDTENSVIDKTKCTGCGACAGACPSGAISLVPYEMPPQQPKTPEVTAAMTALAKEKTAQERIAGALAGRFTGGGAKLMEAVAYSCRRTAEDSLLVRFRLINGGEHEIAPDIRASIPLQKTGRIEAEDDAGRIYRFRDGEISVSAPGVTIDNSNKSGFFALPAGETAECSVTLSNVGPDASRLELLTIPARGLEGGTKRGHIIFSDIPIPKNISR